MGATRFTLSIEDIDAQIASLRKQAERKEDEALEAQNEAAKLKAKAQKLADLKTLTVEIGTPISSGRPKVSRREQIIQFILERGPQTRRAIVETADIPEGTVNSEMRDPAVFVELGGGLWDVTDAIKQEYKEDDGTDQR